MEKRMKPFEKVRIGEWGEDYSGKKGKVVGKGKGEGVWREMKKWDSTGAMEDFISNLDLYGYSEEDLEDLEMIAVRGEDWETMVYTYGGDGFCVMESVYKENLKKVLGK